MQSRVNFIQKLEIDHADITTISLMLNAPDTSTNKEQGFVNAGSLVIFVGEISSQNREDVLNSMLFAQLSADKRYDRLSETDEWYKVFVKVLQIMGLVIENVQFEEYQKIGSTVKVSEAIMEILDDTLSESEKKIVEKTISSLETTENGSCWNVFDKKSSGLGKFKNFQIVPCKEDGHGNIIVDICTFYFKASSVPIHWMWAKFRSSDITLFTGKQSCTLETKVYAHVRDIISQRVVTDAKALIVDCKI